MLFHFSKSIQAKILSFLLLFAILFPIQQVFAIPAVQYIPGDIVAPVPVSDSMIRKKETGITIFGINTGVGFDGLAIIVLREIIEAVGDATVRWINNGFKDSPAGGGQAFAVGLEKVLKDTGDAVAGNIITNLSPVNLCSPFQGQIKIALAKINTQQKNSDKFNGVCPLSSIVGNFDDFLNGNFIDNGGWDSWFKMTQDPMGNPYSSLLKIQGNIRYKVENETNIRKTQLEWGKGFFATTKCAKWDNSSPPKCIEFDPIRTPGTVIENQLEKTLNVEVDQLNIADEFDEVVTAIAGQLLKIVFNGTKGIFDPSNNNYVSNPGGGNTGPNQGTCYPDKTDSIVGEDVTWTYTGATNSNTTYQWSGDEGLTGTQSSATIAYTTAGQKGAQITVTKRVVNGTDPVTGLPTYVNPPTVNTVVCAPKVNVSKYGPLAITCTATTDPVWVPPAAIGSWTIKITGGSGRLAYININEYKTLSRVDPPGGIKPFIFDRLSPNPFMMQGMLASFNPLNVDFETPKPIPTLPPGVAVPSVPPTPTSGIILKTDILYIVPGSREFSFDDIIDLDPSVRPLKDVKCGPKIDVYQRP